MCKLYYCVQAMSYAASITILTVISIERYFAIIYPFRSKMVTTIYLLRIVVVIIWIIAAGCGIPFLIFYDQVQLVISEEKNMYFCVNNYKNWYHEEAYILINFIVWYLIPLILMTVMYTRISIVLWQTSKLGGSKGIVMHSAKFIPKGKHDNKNASQDGHVKLHLKKKFCVEIEEDSFDSTSVTFNREMSVDSRGVPSPVHRCLVEEEDLSGTGTSTDSGHCRTKTYVCDTEEEYVVGGIVTPDMNDEQTSMKKAKSPLTNQNYTNGRNSVPKPLKVPNKNNKSKIISGVGSQSQHFFRRLLGRGMRFNEQSVDRGENALLARRRVIRLLIIVIVTFAACVLPNHINLLCNLWNKSQALTFATYIRSPITYLVFYLNSALNPILYAFLSDNFRKSLMELFGNLRPNSSRGVSRRSTLSGKTAHSVL